MIFNIILRGQNANGRSRLTIKLTRLAVAYGAKFWGAKFLEKYQKKNKNRGERERERTIKD